MTALDMMKTESRLPVWLEWLAWAAAAISLTLYAGFATNGFWGDDWELRAQAIRGASLVDPISSHLRPLVRALFLLMQRTSSPIAFHAISILLHLFTAIAAYSLTKKLYGSQVGRLCALCFFAAFPANEAVYWASAVGVVLCLMFSLLAARAWAFDRSVLAAVLLVPAALSYELWLVAIPLFFLIRRGRLRDWLPTLAVFGVFVLAYVRTFGAGGATAYGGWKWTALPERLTTYAYHAAAPTSESVGMIVAILLLAALVAAVVWAPTLRLAVVLYLSATAILAFAETGGLVSRFCYVPQLALALIVLLLKDTGRIGKWIGTGLTTYLLVASPLWNYLDGRDYRELAKLYTKVAASTNPSLANASAGDEFGFLNRTTPAPLIALLQSHRGRPKAAFVRGAALYGAVYLPDIVALELYGRGLAPQEDEACAGPRLEFGDGAPVARYCFHVIELPTRR